MTCTMYDGYNVVTWGGGGGRYVSELDLHVLELEPGCPAGIHRMSSSCPKPGPVLGLLSTAIARFIADEVRHGIDGTQYLDGQYIHAMNVPADVFQDAEEDDPPGSS